jgi:hypothetical protein
MRNWPLPKTRGVESNTIYRKSSEFSESVKPYRLRNHSATFGRPLEMIKKRASSRTVRFMRTSHIDPDKLYSVDEAAAIASTSRRTLLRALSRGRVAVVMIGGRKIQRAELAGG